MPHIGNFPAARFPHPLVIGFPAYGVGLTDTTEYTICKGVTEFWMRNTTALNLKEHFAPVILPQGARIEKVRLCGHRDDALAMLAIYLYRCPLGAGNRESMAYLNADWTDGVNYIETTNISTPVIDNENYYYLTVISIDPNNAVTDVAFRSAMIFWK